MIHPKTELRWVNDLIGYGVFATAFIPKGTITWVRDDLDQTFTPEQVRRMDEPYRQILNKYTFVDAKGMVVLCWDHSRFVNHSCEANCLSAGYDFEIAIRDVRPDEELTDDYGTLNLHAPFLCACQSPRCRKQIAPDDMAQGSVNSIDPPEKLTAFRQEFLADFLLAQPPPFEGENPIGVFATSCGPAARFIIGSRPVVNYSAAKRRQRSLA